MILVNDEPMAPEPGLTVQRLLASKGFGAAMVAVWIDEELVPRSKHAETLVPDGCSVKIVLMIAGG